MAKKKVTQQENRPESNVGTQNEQVGSEHKAVAMNGGDATAEKLESLKSLNTRLLKEAVEQRKVVDSLVKAKGSLEAELSRSNSEMETAISEFTHLGDEGLRLEIEKEVVFDFVGAQVELQAEAVEREREEIRAETFEAERKMKGLEEEMRRVLRGKREIEKAMSEKDTEIESLSEKMNGLVKEIDEERSASEEVTRERDAVMAKLAVEMENVKGLQAKLAEAEGREKGIRDEAETLAVKCKGMVEEKEEREKRMELVSRERDGMEKGLMEANSAVEEMRGKMEMIGKEKQGIEEGRNVERNKRIELEGAVSALNEMVSSLKEEGERLRYGLDEWAEKHLESLGREEELSREIDEMMTEKKEREGMIERFIEEKRFVEKELGETLKDLDEERHKTLQLANKKRESEEVQERKGREVVELQEKVKGFEDHIRELENASETQMEKVRGLESEIASLKDALEKAKVERDEARKGYEEEKLNGSSLKEKIAEMEKIIEGNLKLVEEMKAENAKMSSEKQELEGQFESLKKEMSSTESALSQAREELGVLLGKLASANAESSRVLSLLKDTAESVKRGKKQVNGGEAGEPYVAEIQLIKNAFRSKESEAEEMAREVEILQKSVAEAKKKSFWAMMSSAATVVVATSLAYIARGH